MALAMDTLYSAPLADFVRRRRALVAELRAAGDAAAARRVAALVKPTRASWAINQVARAEPPKVEAMLEARRAAEVAQRAGGADVIREALKAYRTRTSEVVRAAQDALREAGIAPTATDQRAIADALRAASADDGFFRKRLVSGRLERAMPDEDLVASLERGVPHAKWSRAAKDAPSAEATPRRETATARARASAAAAAAAKARAERAAKVREAAEERARAASHTKQIAHAKRALAAREAAAKKAHDAATRADALVAEGRAALRDLERGAGSASDS